MKPWYQRNKGFTFIEVILSLCIIAVIIISFYSLMDFSNKACIRGEKKDELLLNGRYAIEYIKNEIKSADKIISSDKIEGLYVKFPSNIGFVILQINEDVDPNIYNYVTYHVNGNKIVRVACNRMDDNYPRYYYFSGNNNICEYVDNINKTTLDATQKMIFLDFFFKDNSIEELRLRADIYIRCPIDY